jgi:hypothetical protein
MAEKFSEREIKVSPKDFRSRLDLGLNKPCWMRLSQRVAPGIDVDVSRGHQGVNRRNSDNTLIQRCLH